MIIVTEDVYSRLSSRTKVELMAAIFDETPAVLPAGSVGFDESEFDWEDVVRLSPGEIEEFFNTNIYEGTVKALRIIAEQGPKVHSSQLLGAGFDDLAVFQRSTTRRVRSVTRRKHDFLLSWDDWENGQGHYAVTPETFRSLRIYFKLD